MGIGYTSVCTRTVSLESFYQYSSRLLNNSHNTVTRSKLIMFRSSVSKLYWY